MSNAASATKDSSRATKILSILLYILPAIFFIICYFLIITSGEDIWQGANSQIDIIGDSLAAFKHSVRLADMFAWSVINFFNYNFVFGPDLIFRILDVAAALAIFYMATYIVLRRRPRLRLPDASIFCSIFLAVFLTSNGLTLYAGFSKIHNYLFITFFTLLFGIFYLRDLWGYRAPKSKLFPLFMLILGFVFGFASNVTAIVFLLALLIYSIYKLIVFKSPQNPNLSLNQKLSLYCKTKLKPFFCSWRFAGIIGIILAIALMYLVGNGLGDYDTNPAYLAVCDYLPLSEIFANPLPSIVRILKHNLYNFGRFLFPFLLFSIPPMLCLLTNRLKLGRTAFIKKYRPGLKALSLHKNFLIASLIFIVIHIFAMSQIYYPTRLVLPAYIFAVAIFIFVLKTIFFTDANHNQVAKPRFLKLFAALLIALAAGVIIIRSYFAITYVSRIVPILDAIKNTSSSTYCVSIKDATAKSLPYIHLGQEDFLVDWAMPQTIYNKTITYCDS